MPGHVAFLLHMHQPQYVDPRTGRAELPWVRLHAVRAYLDVARMLDEHERVHLTVNFVPSLVQQLEEVVAGATDAWLAICDKPAREWTPEDREFLVERLFSLHWGRSIEPRPRYRELLDKRGRQVRPEELRTRALAFSDADLRDLTVLFNLSWIGFAAREGDRELDELERKARGYSHEDLALVIDRHRKACARVLPWWRKLSERGQVELSASPYYHPIVPLVIDTEAARRARPDLPLPDRFAHFADAREQIDLGAFKHEKAFGKKPAGMWPPEGSVSPEAVAAYREAGIGWLATDEGNLWRSLSLSGQHHRPRGDLYRAYRHAGVDLVFRDRELSDRIGFAYAHGDSRAGAEDLLGRARACAAESTVPHGEPGLVPIFLDGENPWEAYPGSGEHFLRALFTGLEHDAELRAVSIGEHLAATNTRLELAELHSGSWIDSDFHIWIGDPVKNRAWDELCKVRRLLDEARPRVSDAAFEAAYTRVLAAEGSDWFWWFGEPFHSAEDAIFDRLFRAHLQGALEAIGERPPESLEHPIAPGVYRPGLPLLARDTGLRAPYAFIHPRLEPGRLPSFYEWHGAGRFEVPRGAAMADTPLLERIHFGFDRDNLYLRVDAQGAAVRELQGATFEVELVPADHARRKLRLRADLQPGTGAWRLLGQEGDAWHELGSGSPAVAQLRTPATLVLSAPFAQLGLAPGAQVELAFRLLRGPLALARYPADGTVPLTVPDDAFEAENWSA